VKEGDRVRGGQLLAVIDDGGLQAQLAQLEAQKDLAKTTYERQKRLWDQKIGSEIQFLTAKTQYESTANAVTQLENQLARTRITAPFGGTIDQIIADPGTSLAPGMAVIRIVSLEDMYVEVEVPEIFLPNIHKGSDVRVFFPVLGKEVSTKVRQVSDYIKPANRTFNVEVGIPAMNGSVKPNLNARVFLNDYSNDKAVLIPQSVITENAMGDQYVYVAKDIDGQGRAVVEQTVVKVGKSQGDLVEILEGVQAGDAVIGEGARSLLPGQKVKIIK
jgi:RND family efflux transporter MFP subunit